MILDTIYETKTQLQLAKYSLLLAKHILEVTAIPTNEVITQGFLVNKQWQNKAARVHDVRVVGFQIHELLRIHETPYCKQHTGLLATLLVLLIWQNMQWSLLIMLF